jgi:uncharacterized protein YraI
LVNQRTRMVILLSAALSTTCATPAAIALPAFADPTDQSNTLGSAPSFLSLHTPSPIAVFSPTSPPVRTETPTELPAPIDTLTETPANTPSATTTATVPGLEATVTAELLSCRYGPGPQYLYLYALRAGANIKLIGRTDADNWHWAWVEGANRCWVNTSYLNVNGDWRQLPIVYPGVAGLPVSPYYPPTYIISVVRTGNSITVEWAAIRLRAGDEEDEFMQHYILEAWRCQGGTLLFEPLATNNTFVTFIDESGCARPSHARLFVQEKHGFSGPTEVPWPPVQ